MCASRFPATTPIFLTAQQNDGTFYPGNNHQFGHGSPSFPHPHQTAYQFPQQMPLSSAAPYSPYYSPFYQNTSQQAQQQWETEERHHVVDEPVDLPQEPMTSYLEEEQGQQNAQNAAAAPPSDMPSIPGAYTINAYDPMYWHPRPIFLPLLTPQPQVPQYYQRSRPETPAAEPRVSISLFARRAQRYYRRNRINNRGSVKDVACQYNPEDYLPVTDDTPAATASEETEIVQNPLGNEEEMEKTSSLIPETASSSAVSDAFELIREAEWDIESLQAEFSATSLLGNGDASGQFDDVQDSVQDQHQSDSSKEEVKSYPVKSWLGVHGFSIGANGNAGGIVSLQAAVSETNLRRNDVADGQFDDAAEFDSDTVNNLLKNITSPAGSSTSPTIIPTLNTAFLEGVPVPVSPSPLQPIPEETGGQTGTVGPQDVFPVPNQSVKCAFCKSNGETSEKYSSHAMVNSNNETTCPILSKYVCPVCGKTGKEAHTEKYCPSLVKNKQNGRKKKRHNATGNRVNLKF